jgi:hypothetical protein
MWIAACLPLDAQAPPRLSPKMIAEAIERGTYGDPTPYLLRHAGGRTPNPVIVGAIYTPYLRVALAARAARAAGRTFTEADVTPESIEPVFYVAFRWYCCDTDRPEKDSFNPLVPFDYKVARVRAGDGYAPTARSLQEAIPPLWIRRDVSLLDAFGGALPYDDVVLVVAYPMSALTTDADFVIFRDVSTGRHIRVGRVLASERAQWR